VFVTIPEFDRGGLELFEEGFSEVAAGSESGLSHYFADGVVCICDQVGCFFQAGGIDELEGGGLGRGF